MQHFYAAAVAMLIAGAAHATSFQTVHVFTGTDGGSPYGKLVADSHGKLYGTAAVDGPNGGGSVFQFDLATGTLTTLYGFTYLSAAGSNPQAGVIIAGGTLYGVTANGGANASACSQGCGTLFKLNIATQKLTVLYNFTGLADGGKPLGGLVRDHAGVLYGTTTYYGAGDGTVFKFNPASKIFTTLHQFGVNNAADGDGPQSTLVFGPGGLLYGSVPRGGPHGSGVIYSVDPATGAFALLHGFDYHVDGSGPQCDLIFSGGLLVGTTYAGGPTSADDGTIFTLDPASLTLATLYSFQGGNDGVFARDGLTKGPGGLLYGPTVQGGPSGAGTLYAINPNTAKYKQEYALTTADGGLPSGQLTLVGGALYGLTSGGHGSIYKLIP